MGKRLESYKRWLAKLAQYNKYISSHKWKKLLVARLSLLNAGSVNVKA